MAIEYIDSGALCMPIGMAQKMFNEAIDCIKSIMPDDTQVHIVADKDARFELYSDGLDSDDTVFDTISIPMNSMPASSQPLKLEKKISSVFCDMVWAYSMLIEALNIDQRYSLGNLDVNNNAIVKYRDRSKHKLAFVGIPMNTLRAALVSEHLLAQWGEYTRVINRIVALCEASYVTTKLFQAYGLLNDSLKLTLVVNMGNTTKRYSLYTSDTANMIAFWRDRMTGYLETSMIPKLTSTEFRNLKDVGYDLVALEILKYADLKKLYDESDKGSYERVLILAQGLLTSVAISDTVANIHGFRLRDFQKANSEGMFDWRVRGVDVDKECQKGLQKFLADHVKQDELDALLASFKEESNKNKPKGGSSDDDDGIVIA